MGIQDFDTFEPLNDRLVHEGTKLNTKMAALYSGQSDFYRNLLSQGGIHIDIDVLDFSGTIKEFCAGRLIQCQGI